LIFNNLLIFATLVAAAIVIISRDWRVTIGGLAILYLLLFILVIQIWPIALASVKLISGLMGISLISAARINSEKRETNAPQSEHVFRLLLSILVWLVLAASAPTINEWLPISYTNLYIGLSLISSGLLFSSLVRTPYEKTIGVLLFLIGFDVIYSSLEGSALVTAVYALITILISVLSGYFPDPIDSEAGI
jgi:hypothetical protein